MRPVPRAFLLAVLTLLLAPVAARADVTPDFFTVPDGRTVGNGLAVDAAGHVWAGGATLSSETAPPLYELDPSAGNAITVRQTPLASGEARGQVRDVAVDRTTGRVWFTRDTGVVGNAGLPGFTGAQVAYAPSKMDLGDIAVAADGSAWFAERRGTNATGWPGSRIAHASSSLGFTDGPVIGDDGTGKPGTGRYDAKPTGVTIGADGAAWFTEAEAGLPGYRIGRVGGTGGSAYTERLLPCVAGSYCSGDSGGTGPTSIAALPDGTLWFNNQLKHRFGVLDPAKDTITEYSLGEIGLGTGIPWTIRAAPDRTLWLTVRASGYFDTSNALVHIVPGSAGAAPTATAYGLDLEHRPFSVAVSPTTGDVWFTTNGRTGTGGTIGRLPASAIAEDGGTPGGGTPGGGTTGGGTTTGDGGIAGDTGSGGTTTTPAGTLPTQTTKPGAVVLQAVTVARATVQDPKVKGDDVSASQICVGPPADKCSVVYLLQTHEYVSGFPGTQHALAARKRKTRLVTVGSKSVTLAGGQSKVVTVSLNKRGRRILKRDGKLNATWTVKQRVNGKLVQVKSKKVRFKKRKR